MDKKIIIDALKKAFLSEAASTPAISLSNSLKTKNEKINKDGVKQVAKDMEGIEKAQKKDDSNQKSMAQNKFNAVGEEQTYHEEMEIMNGQEMIEYDRDPNAEFKKRAIEAIEGSSRMGNNPEWANVVAKGQGGDPEFGKNLVKKIKASQKKRVKQTPTTKMYGDDWEVTDNTSHKEIAVESTEKKPTINEVIGRDLKKGQQYTWTMGAEPLTVKYIGLRRDNPSIQVSASVGKGFIFQFQEGKSSYIEVGPQTLSQYIEPIESQQADIAGDNYEDSNRAAQAGAVRYENKKPQIKESMKRLKFKKEFNGVGNALKLIPESYKVDMKVFEMTDLNETYQIRWEGSATDGKAIVLAASDKKLVNEDIQRMKQLFNYKSQDTLGTVKGNARLDENAAFADVWNKTKKLLTEDENIESVKPKTGELDKIKPTGSVTAKIKSQEKTSATTKAKTGDLDDAVDFATKENEPEAKKKLQTKDGTAPASKGGDLDDAVGYATKEVEPEAKKKLQTKDGTAPAPKKGNWEEANVGQAAEAKKHIKMNEEIEGDEDDNVVDTGRKDAYDASLDVPDVDDMNPSSSDIKDEPLPAATSGSDEDDDEDDVVVPPVDDTVVKLVSSRSREGVFALRVIRNGKNKIVDLPSELVDQARQNPKAVLAKLEADTELV